MNSKNYELKLETARVYIYNYKSSQEKPDCMMIVSPSCRYNAKTKIGLSDQMVSINQISRGQSVMTIRGKGFDLNAAKRQISIPKDVKVHIKAKAIHRKETPKDKDDKRYLNISSESLEYIILNEKLKEKQQKQLSVFEKKLQIFELWPKVKEFSEDINWIDPDLIYATASFYRNVVVTDGEFTLKASTITLNFNLNNLPAGTSHTRFWRSVRSGWQCPSGRCPPPREI